MPRTELLLPSTVSPRQHFLLTPRFNGVYSTRADAKPFSTVSRLAAFTLTPLTTASRSERLMDYVKALILTVEDDPNDGFFLV
jgi:hypothetical protein